MKFKIDTAVLSKISAPGVKLDSQSEKKAAHELTTNCGCGGRCLGSTT